MKIVNFALSGPIFKIRNSKYVGLLKKLQATISLSKYLKQSVTVGRVVAFLFHTVWMNVFFYLFMDLNPLLTNPITNKWMNHSLIPSLINTVCLFGQCNLRFIIKLKQFNQWFVKNRLSFYAFGSFTT